MLEKEFYTIIEFADILGISKSTVYNWLKNGTINAIKAGRQWRIPREEIERIGREGTNVKE